MQPVTNYLIAWLERDPPVAEQDHMIDVLTERYGQQGLDAWAAAIGFLQDVEVAAA